VIELGPSIACQIDGQHPCFFQVFIVMTTFRVLSAAIFATSMALAGAAQAQPAPAASMPMAGASTPQDCAKPMAKHDHGAEKGTPSAKTMAAPCAPMSAAPKPADAASTPKKLGNHDHAKMHKSM
jgi:hypothetical protein